MPPPPAPARAPGSAPGQATVTVRYWAAAREAAGCAEEQVRGATLGEVLDGARARHADQPRFGRVLDVCSFILGEQPVGSRRRSDVPVADGDVLEVLPPFAGGAPPAG
ncbi:MAG TPA: MoaD/ThiS family protein [Nocardioidaceae bacterium]|nr:MoaD/ThiS family protein [Nocardioidaceae bacterium]